MDGKEYLIARERLLDNSVLLCYFGLVWLISSLIGLTEYPGLSILLFFIGTTLVKPAVRRLRKLLLKDPKESEESNLILSCLTIGTPAGMMTVFFLFVENINLFFPAFSIISGVVFALFGQISKSKFYWSIGFLIILSAVYSWYNYLPFFAPSGLISSFIMLSYAFVARITPYALKYTMETAKKTTTPLSMDSGTSNFGGK